MTKARSRNRIVLHLSTRIALEAIILNRLEKIPHTRRQEWLRGLLVQGFCLECQALRQGTEVLKPEPRMRFSGWLMSDSTKRTSKPIKQNQKTMAQEVNEPTATKPFAELSRIIG